MHVLIDREVKTVSTNPSCSCTQCTSSRLSPISSNRGSNPARTPQEGGGVRSRPGTARTILLSHIISARPSKQPLMVRTFLKVYMELGFYFLFLQEQIKDIIINQKLSEPARLSVLVILHTSTDLLTISGRHRCSRREARGRCRCSRRWEHPRRHRYRRRIRGTHGRSRSQRDHLEALLRDDAGIAKNPARCPNCCG